MPWLKPKRALLIFLYQEKKDKIDEGAGKRFANRFPEEEEDWCFPVYATRRADSVEEAREVLLEGLTLNFESAIIRYNLACMPSLGSPWRMHGFFEGLVQERSKIQDFGFRR